MKFEALVFEVLNVERTWVQRSACIGEIDLRTMLA